MPNPVPELIAGPYRAPRFRYGQTVLCEARGQVRIVGLSSGCIPWPLAALPGHQKAGFVLCADLTRAVQTESSRAICYWWAVTKKVVAQWRAALGIGSNNVGTRRLRQGQALGEQGPVARKKAVAKARDPERCRKIGEAGRGRTLSAVARQKIGDAHRGRKHSPEARRRMSEAQRRRGAWPPAAGRPWSAEEETLLGTMPDGELATLIGRSSEAVRQRRTDGGIPTFRDRRWTN